MSCGPAATSWRWKYARSQPAAGVVRLLRLPHLLPKPPAGEAAGRKAPQLRRLLHRQPEEAELSRRRLRVCLARYGWWRGKIFAGGAA